MFRHFVFTFLLLFGSAFAGDDLNSRLVNEIMDYTGANSFVASVNSIKKGQRPSPSHPFYTEELSDKENEYWRDFPVGEYQSGLRKQLIELFSTDQLRNIRDFYKVPFPGKIISLLNTKAALNGLLSNKEFLSPEAALLSKNKVALIQSVINLHKINPLIHHQKEKLKSRIRKQRKLLEILKQGAQAKLHSALRSSEKLLQDFDVNIMKLYAAAFFKIRESELRELVRIMRPKLYQDAGQLLVSYHYYFLENYTRSLESN